MNRCNEGCLFYHSIFLLRSFCCMLFFIVARIYGVFFESGVASKLSIKTKTFPVIKPKSISVKKETAVSGLRYFISLER